MRAPEEKALIDGPAGKIELVIENPGAPKGIALVCHPHPLFGGANSNKVAHSLARTFVAMGYCAFRPNFRGVGQSEGAHDEGRGETEDMLAVIAEAKRRCGDLPVALAGFSFGGFVQTRVAKALAASGHPAQRLVLPSQPPWTASSPKTKSMKIMKRGRTRRRPGAAAHLRQAILQLLLQTSGGEASFLELVFQVTDLHVGWVHGRV